MISYRAHRRWPRPRARSFLSLRTGDPIPTPSDLAHFLSARWVLYTQLGRRLAVGKVWHEPWPLHSASVESIDDGLVGAAGYNPPVGPPHTMFSPGVAVRVDRPRLI